MDSYKTLKLLNAMMPFIQHQASCSVWKLTQTTEKLSYTVAEFTKHYGTPVCDCGLDKLTERIERLCQNAPTKSED